MARRGIPRQIISDNAQQFKVGLEQDVDEVSKYSTRQGIQWSFIVALAPWMGGFYERLVGITKRVLKKTLGNQYLTEKQLTTILVETEAVVNSCPLVYH